MDPFSWAAFLAGPLGMARHTSTQRRRLPEHPVRARIMGAIAATPGLLLVDLRRVVGCSLGNIQHHVRLLERAGYVISVSAAQRRHFFPADMGPAERSAVAALARRGRAIEVMQAIDAWPGQSRTDLAARLATRRAGLAECLRDLETAGLIEGRRDGRHRRYWPTGRFPQLTRGWSRPVDPPGSDRLATAVDILETPRP